MKFTVESDVLSDMAMLLLHAVSAAHVHHWNTIGPGAYAEHKAIGNFYEELDTKSDFLIEGCLLDNRKIISPQRAFFLGKTSLELVQYVYDQVDLLRRNPGFPQESEVQNAVDEIQMLCRHTINKLVRLA